MNDFKEIAKDIIEFTGNTIDTSYTKGVTDIWRSVIGYKSSLTIARGTITKESRYPASSKKIMSLGTKEGAKRGYLDIEINLSKIVNPLNELVVATNDEIRRITREIFASHDIPVHLSVSINVPNKITNIAKAKWHLNELKSYSVQFKAHKKASEEADIAIAEIKDSFYNSVQWAAYQKELHEAVQQISEKIKQAYGDPPRGPYGQLHRDNIRPDVVQKLDQMIAAIQAGQEDSHGSWQFSAEFDSKGRGEAINMNIYATGNDYHTSQPLFIVQIGQYSKQTTRGYPNIRKNYFLIGKNEEDQTVFAHPVQSQVIHRAIQDGKSNNQIILAVQKWIFGGNDYTELIRQGDLAFVPVSRKPSSKHLLQPIGTIQIESHSIRANTILMREFSPLYYCLNPVSDHPTHKQIAAKGWYKVVLGKRAKYWKFAPPTKD